jgi:mannose-6-phosphate isomerase-like protein (cupin superfamily)
MSDGGGSRASSVDGYEARVVVTGLDGEGRSTVVSDQHGSTRIDTAAFTTIDTWQLAGLPVPVEAASTLGPDVVIDPPQGGLVVRMIAYPPDAEWMGSEAQAEALAAVGGSASDDDVPGMHITDTVDVLTVVEGEIWAVLESTEVRLTVGDTIVQRGTRHAWSNRSDRRAVLVATMVSAQR